MRESDVAHIIKGSMFLSLGSVVVIVIDTMAFAVIARVLSQVEIGITITFELVFSVSILISDLGFTTALIKYISEFRGSKKDYRPLISAGIALRGLIATLIALLCIMAAPQISSMLLKTENYSYLFILVGLNVIIVCLNETLRSIFWGLDELKKIVVIGIFNTVTGQIIILAFLLSGWGLVGFLIGLVIKGLSYTCACFFFLFRDKHFEKYSLSKIGESIKQLSKFSLSVFGSSVTSFIYQWFDRSIVLSYFTLSDLAIYGVAYKIFRILSMFPANIRTALLPFYGEHYGEKDYQAISVNIKKITRYQALLYTPLAIGLATIARHAIVLFVGEQYASGDIILAIFCIFSLSMVFNPALQGLLYIFNRPQSVFLLNLAQIAITLTATPILLIYLNLGIMGIALSKAANIPLATILFSLYIKKILSIKVDKEAILKSFISGFAMALVIKVTETLLPGMHMFPIYIVIGGITYIIMLKLTKAVDNEDIKLANEILGGKLNPILKYLGASV